MQVLLCYVLQHFCINSILISCLQVLKARDMFRQNPPSHIPRGQFGIIEANFAVCITLLHSLELLSLYGLRSFLNFLQGMYLGK